MPRPSQSHLWGALVGRQLGFRSTFPLPDAMPRRTGRNKAGRGMTAGAVGELFLLVTADERGRVGMGRDLPGAAPAACKTAGYAYTGSNPVPATQPLSCENTAAWHLSYLLAGAGLPSDFPPADAPPTASGCPAPRGRGCPRSGRLVWAPSSGSWWMSMRWAVVPPSGWRGSQPGDRLCDDRDNVLRRLVLPEPQDRPPCRSQGFGVALVPGPVSLDLGFPVIPVGSGRPSM